MTVFKSPWRVSVGAEYVRGLLRRYFPLAEKKLQEDLRRLEGYEKEWEEHPQGIHDLSLRGIEQLREDYQHEFKSLEDKIAVLTTGMVKTIELDIEDLASLRELEKKLDKPTWQHVVEAEGA